MDGSCAVVEIWRHRCSPPHCGRHSKQVGRSHRQSGWMARRRTENRMAKKLGEETTGERRSVRPRKAREAEPLRAWIKREKADWIEREQQAKDEFEKHVS